MCDWRHLITIRENYVYLTTRNRERILEGYGRNVQFSIDTTNTYHRRCVEKYIADKKEVCREFHFKGKILKKLSSICRSWWRKDIQDICFKPSWQTNVVLKKTSCSTDAKLWNLTCKILCKIPLTDSQESLLLRTDVVGTWSCCL